MQTHIISHYATNNAMTTGTASFTRVVTSEESVDDILDRIKACHLSGFIGIITHSEEIENRMVRAMAV